MSIASVLKAARANAPSTDGLTPDQLREAISRITDDMRRPGMSHAERLTLNEDRHVYRRALAAREADPS